MLVFVRFVYARVLDPIDGTKGFVRGGQYAVGLAYVIAGVPVLAVVGCPNLACADGSIGCIFSAGEGICTSSPLYCITLYCDCDFIVLYCIVLYCIVLYNMVW